MRKISNYSKSGSISCEKPPRKTQPIRSPMKPTCVYDSYWRFAAERQCVFFRRFRGQPEPWTSDPIIQQHKFTNAYRASDRVSQYLIRNVIYSVNISIVDTFFRILLFKLFNKIETWELLTQEFGVITWADFKLSAFDKCLSQAMSRNVRIYSAAYIMPSGGKIPKRKHLVHLELLQYMMKEDLPKKISHAKTMQQAFGYLRQMPGIGDFLAYQYVTDLNYSHITDFSETSFVVPGPGAKNGIRKCFSDFGGLSEIEIISWMCEHQEGEFKRLGIEFLTLWGRPLQLIDCQNLFCEVDKYARVAHPDVQGVTQRTRIKQIHKPDYSPISYFYPPKWGLNKHIAASLTKIHAGRSE